MITHYCDRHITSFPSPHLSSLRPHISPPLRLMVSAKGRKRGKPAKNAFAGIRQGIPFDQEELVTRHQVAGKLKNRVLTKSTKVVVPLPPSIPSEPSGPHLQPPSDQDPPPIPSTRTRKGPSRSASVSMPPPPPPLFFTELTRVQSNLEQWLQYRDEFSNELMRHEALYLGGEPSPCETCGSSDALFRCLDCFSCGPSCGTCIVHQHAHNILHRLQVCLHSSAVCHV